MKMTAISKKKRFEVFKRDGFTCQYCGDTPPKAILHVDHINPVSKGGKNDMDNLITACDSCNLGKSANLLTSIPESLKEKAARVAESEEQIKGFRKIMDEKENRIIDDAWSVAAVLEGVDYVESYNRRNFASIKKFLELLPYHEVIDSAEISMSKSYNSSSQFKYFCGACWRKIRGEQNG